MEIVAQGQAAEPAEASAYAFTPLPGALDGLLQERGVRDSLLKWGLDRTLVMEQFRVAGPLGGKDFAPEGFLLDLVNHEAVQARLAEALAGPKADLRRPSGRASRVQFEPLGTSATDLSMFARLKEDEHRIVSQSGYIRKCMDEVYDGATACNRLMDMFLNEESESALVFEESEKKELLYVLLGWLCVGGSLNQPEEAVEPYYDVLKKLYKTLVQAVKSPESGEIEIASRAYLITGIDNSTEQLFPEENANSRCIVVVSPNRRTVTYFSSAFLPFFK